MQAHHSAGLSEIAEEFRLLDAQRRRRGLSLADAERYHSLFARLSEVLEAGERHRRADARQFLRIRFPMTLFLRTPGGILPAACSDFGGGGCAIEAEATFKLEEDVWLDGAELFDQRHELHGRGVVSWVRLPARGQRSHGYGLRFAIDCPKMRDQVDRLFYRVLDLFLRPPSAGATGGERRAGGAPQPLAQTAAAR